MITLRQGVFNPFKTVLLCRKLLSVFFAQLIKTSIVFFSRYVLVAQPEIREPHVQATAMEETLLLLRFPKSRVRRRHTSASTTSLRSNRIVRVRTGHEM